MVHKVVLEFVRIVLNRTPSHLIAAGPTSSSRILLRIDPQLAPSSRNIVVPLPLDVLDSMHAKNHTNYTAVQIHDLTSLTQRFRD